MAMVRWDHALAIDIEMSASGRARLEAILADRISP
jgi:hypothetical protein